MKQANAFLFDVNYPSDAYYLWKKYCQPKGTEHVDCEQSDPGDGIRLPSSYALRLVGFCLY
jgi:hypothetical protein